MKIKGLNIFWVMCLSISMASLMADDAYETSMEIEQRLNNMTTSELVDRAKGLKAELSMLKEEQESSQSPEKLKDISNRISSITSEMDMIQKILIALGAGDLIANL